MTGIQVNGFTKGNYWMEELKCQFENALPQRDTKGLHKGIPRDASIRSAWKTKYNKLIKLQRNEC